MLVTCDQRTCNVDPLGRPVTRWKVWAFRLEGSPSGHSRSLAEAAPGFPLLSLTRNAGSLSFI